MESTEKKLPMHEIEALNENDMMSIKGGKTDMLQCEGAREEGGGGGCGCGCGCGC